MTGHVHTMLTLRDAYYELDLAQELVDRGRRIKPDNYKFQQEMDRRQIDLDYRRHRILIAMAHIAQKN